MKYKLTSGVAATRFSKGKVSLGTPTVNFEYGIPLGFSAEESSANDRALVNDGKLIRVLTNSRKLLLLIALTFWIDANRIMVLCLLCIS